MIDLEIGREKTDDSDKYNDKTINKTRQEKNTCTTLTHPELCGVFKRDPNCYERM